MEVGQEGKGKKPIVLDGGSDTFKAGVAWENIPQVVFPSVIGRPQNEGVIDTNPKDSYIGDEAMARWRQMIMRHPIDRAFVRDWEDIEKFYGHCFSRLNLEPVDRMIFLTDGRLGLPRAGREKSTEIMFEKFNVRGISVYYTQALSLLATGTTAGLSIESGGGVTYISPVYEGYCLPQGVSRLDLGGNDLDRFLCHLINRDRTKKVEYQIENMEALKTLKETLCFVSSDYEEDSDNPSRIEKSYTLPSGESITIGAERFQVPEVLFDPSLIGLEEPSIVELAYNGIMKCDVEIRKEMYGNIVFGGGNTMFNGIVDRFEKELSKLLAASSSSNTQLKFKAPPERKYSAWIGGSALASLSTYDQWALKSEYEENGPAIIHRKCI